MKVTNKLILILIPLAVSMRIGAAGLYDATFEKNELVISLLKVGDSVYEAAMALEESSDSLSLKCTELCLRLTRAKVVTSFSGSIYSIYDEQTQVLLINNLWYEDTAYSLSLRLIDEVEGSYYFGVESSEDESTYPLFLTSYENKNHLNVSTQSIPIHWTKGGYYFANNTAYAFADFFQDGSLSFFQAQLTYRPTNPLAEMTPSILSFWSKNQDGEWIERTSELLSESDSLGCYHPRKALIADFNNDGKPDIWLACTGYDAGSFPGENQSLLLSQNSGVYKTLEIPDSKYYAHGASAADINADGFPDVLMVDGPPFFFLNNGDGTFSEDRTRIPNITINSDGTFDEYYITSELVDVNSDGFVDIVLAGGGNIEAISPVKIVYNDGNGMFTKQVTLPVSKDEFNLTLDVVVEQGFAYLLQTRTDPYTYDGSSVKKVDLSTMGYEVIFKAEDKSGYNTIVESEHNPYIGGIPPPNGPVSSWIDWIVPFKDRIVSPSVVYGLDVPL